MCILARKSSFCSTLTLSLEHMEGSQKGTMKTLKFKQIFLNLHPRKKALIREYCRLYEDTNLSPDVLIDQISNIWKRAGADPELTTCLQLADYIYTDVDEDKEIDANKRAYLCEHLTSEVGLGLEKTEKIPTSNRLELSEISIAESCILQCPGGDYVLVEENLSKDPNSLNSLRDKTCSQCGEPFKVHRTARHGVASPDS